MHTAPPFCKEKEPLESNQPVGFSQDPVFYSYKMVAPTPWGEFQGGCFWFCIVVRSCQVKTEAAASSSSNSGAVRPWREVPEEGTKEVMKEVPKEDVKTEAAASPSSNSVAVRPWREVPEEGTKEVMKEEVKTEAAASSSSKVPEEGTKEVMKEVPKEEGMKEMKKQEVKTQSAPPLDMVMLLV